MKQLIQHILGQFGYRLQKLSKIKSFTPFIRNLNFPDVSFQMWIANQEASAWYEQEHLLECGELQALQSLAKNGDRILEIGAHHGVTALLLSKIVGQNGYVYGVEAHPNNTMVAQAQLGLNRSINNLHFVNLAACDVSGTARINACHNSNLTSEIKDSIEVEAVTGDMLDKQNGPFNFLKIDVEGYELEVLKGCQGILARAPKIALEIHMDTIRKRGQSLADILDLIGIQRYEGVMSVRPDKFREIETFDPSAIPEDSITNILLQAKEQF